MPFLPYNAAYHTRRIIGPFGSQFCRWSSGASTVFNESVLEGNKVHIRSLGCARNWVDSEVMLGTLLRHGYEATLEPSQADVLVVNTCAFLGAARRESRDTIRDMISVKGPRSKLVVTGCMVNLHKQELLEEFPNIDHILSSGAIDKIVEALQSGQQEFTSTAKSFLEAGDVPRKIATPKHYAYLKIAEGCRKRCSFCIIPKIKGPLQSKNHEQILKEMQALLRTGTKEIILIAQDLGDYGKDLHPDAPKTDYLAPLLRTLLAECKGDYWLRLLYLYPDEITEDLLAVVREDPRVCRYFDMPIQHASNKVLRRMRRKTSREDVENTLQLVRQMLPDAVIRTTLMVGFPGETEEDFQELMDFVGEQKMDHVGVFKFSPEPESDAGKAETQVSEAMKARRYKVLTAKQTKIAHERVRSLINTTIEVVVDAIVPQKDDTVTYICRHRGQAPDVDGVVLVNDANIISSEDKHGQDVTLNPKSKANTSSVALGKRLMVQVTGYDRQLNLLGSKV